MDGRAKPRKHIRAELVARVQARRAELEEAIFARVRDGDYSPDGIDDPEYVTGLRAAVGAAIDHGLGCIATGGDGSESIPPETVAQAHRAARTSVSVDTVLRRYVIGSALMGDFLMQEADRTDLPGDGTALRELLSAQALVLDRLMAAITGEYMRELERTEHSSEKQRTKRVQLLLAGETTDSAQLDYELNAWHLGVIAVGAKASEALRDLATRLGTRVLSLPRGEETAWGWLGSQESVSLEDIELVVSEERLTDVSFALGEPGRGVEGWRLTHHQAQAALRVAMCSRRKITTYSEVALVASVLRDDALARSLVDIYLSPLGDRHKGGAILRQTLRAYFTAGCNASSAASALRVARHTVENRLRTIEEKLGHTLRTRQAELEVALRLEELDDDALEHRSSVL